MNILLLCNKSPWPPLEGGPIAMNAMVQGLIEAGHSLKVLAVNSNKYSISPEDIPEAYQAKTQIEMVYVDLSIKPVAALKSFLLNRSHHIQRFITPDFADTLRKILSSNKFDVVQFETLFTTPYIALIRQYSDARLVLRAHNIEHLIWQRMAKGCRNPLKRFYLRHLANTLKRYEEDVIKQLDGIVAITGTDADRFVSEAPEVPVIAIPFGISSDESPVEPASQSVLDLFHLGSMNWLPNQEGIRWFLDEVWPVIHEKYPALTFSLAGRAMPGWLSAYKAPGVIIDGEVADARTYMQSHGLMIVPLFSGSGIRIKIIEGMQQGKTVITTPVGAEGIDYTDGENLLIARNRDEYIRTIEKCLNTPGLADSIGIAARTLVAEKHNNRLLMQKLTDFYAKLKS